MAKTRESPPLLRPASARFAELFALATLSVAQPLFDLLGRAPAFFLAHRSSRTDLLLVALVPTVGLAAFLLAVEVVLTRLRRPNGAAAFHTACLALLGTNLGLLLARRLPALPSSACIALAALFGLLVAALGRRPAFAWFLQLAGVCAVALPLHFLLLTPVRRLLSSPPGETPRAAVAPAGSPQHPDVPVVMIVFDELPLSSLLDREGRLAHQRFPAFAELAARSTWYRRTTSVAEGTDLAVPALLTGKLPAEGSLPVVADHPLNLFTLLAGSHAVHALESLTQLCPQTICTGERQEPTARAGALVADLGLVYLHLLLPPRLVGELPPVTGTWAGFGDRAAAADDSADGRRRNVPRQLDAFLTRLAATKESRPGLHYLHLELPHIPWRYLNNGQEYGPISTSFFAHGVGADTLWRHDDWLLAQGLQRHLLQLAYADRVLARILAAMAEQGLAERALLVVTADHGLAFQPGEPGRRVNRANFAEVLAVPLFVRLPGQLEGAVSELPARTIDVLPTIADAIGLALPPDTFTGRSLLRPTQFPARDEVVHVERGGERFALAEVAPALERASERIAHSFGNDGPASDLYALDAVAGLRGERLAVAESELPPRAGVALEQPWFFDRVDPRGSFVPAQIVGRLLALPGHPLDEPVELAVTVNGVVRATTRSFQDGAAVRFAALVAPDSFVAGRNVVEVRVIVPGSPPRLAPTVDRSGPRYSLRRDAGGAVAGIDASNGTGCTLDPEAVRGALVREEWYLAGWAIPRDERWPFAVVMVFVGDELVHVVPTGGQPPAGTAGEKLSRGEKSGFRFSIPESLRRGDDARLRVFGVAGERCTLLELAPPTSAATTAATAPLTP